MILGTGASPGNWAQIPQIMGMDIQKFIQSVKLNISHQLKPYSGIKPSEGRVLAYCFRVFGALGHFGGTGPKLSPCQYPKSKTFNLSFHMK